MLYIFCIIYYSALVRVLSMLKM